MGPIMAFMSGYGMGRRNTQDQAMQENMEIMRNIHVGYQKMFHRETGQGRKR